MAVICWDLAAADDTNDGSTWALAKKNLGGASGASAAAGANGTIKCAGKQLIAVGAGNGTWTINDVHVTFAEDVTATVAALDWIRPAGVADCPAYKVSSIDYNVTTPGVTTIHLEYAFRLASGAYATKKIPVYAGNAAQNMTSGATGQTITFGWKSDDTQPADFVTALEQTTAAGALTMLTINQANTIVTAGDATLATRLLVLGGSTNNTICLVVSASSRFLGTLDVSGGYAAAGSVQIQTLNTVIRLDRVLSSRSYQFGYFQWANIHIDYLAVHNSGDVTVQCLYGGPQFIGELQELGCTKSYSGGSGCFARIGKLYVRKNGGTSPATAASGWVLIGYLDTSADPNAITPTGPSFVAGPIAKWKHLTPDDAVTKVTGRGGTGLGMMIDPSSKLRPAYAPPLIFMAKAADVGLGLTLNFYAYYSGTGGGGTHTPECWVELLEPNGLTCSKYTFTPPNGSNFTDATQMTISFTGTIAQLGSLQAVICCVDNSDADAILYVDDATWTAA